MRHEALTPVSVAKRRCGSGSPQGCLSEPRTLAPRVVRPRLCSTVAGGGDSDDAWSAVSD